MKRLMLIIAVGSMSIAHAQNYTKDVDITVELNPEVRAASRLDISPALRTMKFDVAPLSFTGRAISAPVSAMITPLNVPGPQLCYNRPDHRGYLSAGYFYSEDFGVTAGYRVVASADTRLDLWTQFNHGTTSGNTMDILRGSTDESITLVTNNLSIGGNFAAATGAGCFTADGSFFLSRFNYPMAGATPEHQNMHRVKFDADWSGPVDSDSRFTYAIEAGIEQSGFADVLIPQEVTFTGSDKSLGEISAEFGTRGAYSFSQQTSLAINLGYRLVSTSGQHAFNPGMNILSDQKVETRGLLDAGVSFKFDRERFNGLVGADLELYSGNDAGNFLGFNAQLDWLPSHYFAIGLNAKSGSILNTISDMFELDRYALPLMGAGESRLNIDGKASMRIGPFYGLSFTAWGGICSAADWLTPSIMDGLPVLTQQDLETAYYTLILDYDAGQRIGVHASLEGALSDKSSHSFYKWSDRAKHVATIGVVWHPIDALTLGAEYEYRDGRRVSIFDYRNIEAGYYEHTLKKIGNTGHTNVTLNYNFGRCLSFYARVTGIGQKKYSTIAGTPGSRLAGLIGVTFRF